MTDVPHVLTWEELCADPSLSDLPYRIELNGLNQIVMSPTNVRHGWCMGRIADKLWKLLPGGKVSVASAMMTSDNVKVADVIWATDEFSDRYADACALLVAPDICVEVLSPTNRTIEIDQKRALYFESGAREVWICGLKGEMKFYDPTGLLESSIICPDFPSWIDI